jgi:hypothetical protein
VCRLRPAAHPDRVAALVPLALVGQGRGRRAAVFLLGSVVDPGPLQPEYPAIGNPLAVPPALVGPLRTATGVALVVTVLAIPVAAGLAAHNWAVTNGAVGLYLALPPLATGAAILRYRLYDLDRIISRTLAYGLLTILLGLGYAGVVLGLGRLLPQDSSLVVAGATLAVAAVFQPARRRIQQLVDRRFNRRRYDAAQMIAAFSARLRDEVDLDTLTGELLAVVHQAIQPTQATLWLRPQGPPSTAAGTAAHGPAVE